MMIALRKRPVEPERMERVVNGIVRRLESSGESEIKVDTIGALVMEALAFRPGRLCPFRFGLPQFPRSKRFEGSRDELAEEVD